MKAPLLPFLMLFGSCGWNAAGMTGCQPNGSARALPEGLNESSGVAWSRSSPGVLFSHNDGGHEATLYALDTAGALLGEISLEGAQNRDWEDMAIGTCGTGTCVYLADVGDNAGARDRIILYRTREPEILLGSPGTVETTLGASQTAEAFPMVLPDGPRDMEALFVLPGEEVFFVSKGRHQRVTLYRYPPPLRTGETVTLEAIQSFSQDRLPTPRQVTGADASADGRTVAIRSYESLTFYTWKDDQLVPMEGGRVYLRTLDEAQGEAVALGPGGKVALTSEKALRRRASLSILQCRVGIVGEAGR